MFRKKFLVAGIAIALVVVTIVSVSANPAGFKAKNLFQLAESSGDTAQVEAAEDFRYTHFDIADTTNSQSKTESESQIENTSARVYDNEFAIEKEFISADPKINIYNKMLNTIDNFNNLSLSMETTMLSDGVTTVEYQIDINSNLSYQSLSEDGKVKSETYSEADNMILVNNLERTYMQNYLPTYTRSDTPYIPLESRITTGDDGIPCYSYRRNVTNCPLASYSVVPQEITYSYLKDFDKWEIEDDNVTYLDRNCIKIVGTPSPYIAAKHNIDSFTMLVDSDTGILMDFHGTLDGNVSRYMTVTECTFGAKSVIKQFDLANYNAYTEVRR